MVKNFTTLNQTEEQDTFQDIISECFEALRKDIESEIEQLQSDEIEEFIQEEFTNN